MKAPFLRILTIYLFLPLSLLITPFHRSHADSLPLSNEDCPEFPEYPQFPDDGEPTQDPYTSEIVIKFNDSSILSTIMSTFSLELVGIISTSSNIYLLEIPDPSIDADYLDDLIRNNNSWSDQIAYVEPNYIGNVPEANPASAWAWGGTDSSPSGTQYANVMLGIDTAHQLTLGTGTTVAVLDTGVWLTHPYFGADTLLPGFDFVDDDNIPNDETIGLDTDDDGLFDEAAGHGTHVAGIVHTVAPGAKILPVRVLDSEGRGDVFLIAEAILYAASHGADIINLSLGTTFASEVLEDAIQTAYDEHKTIIVSAAGNNNSSDRQYPAGFNNNVISVTSVNENKIKATDASYGCWVDVVAPGESIFSAFPETDYAWWSGTSMATPFVSGTLALALSQSNGPADAISVMTITAESLDSLNPGYTDELGAGLINTGQAVIVSVPPTAITLTAHSAEINVLPTHLLIVFATTFLALFTFWYKKCRYVDSKKRF